jgi:hypothetical protein
VVVVVVVVVVVAVAVVAVGGHSVGLVLEEGALVVPVGRRTGGGVTVLVD